MCQSVHLKRCDDCIVLTHLCIVIYRILCVIDIVSCRRRAGLWIKWCEILWQQRMRVTKYQNSVWICMDFSFATFDEDLIHSNSLTYDGVSECVSYAGALTWHRIFDATFVMHPIPSNSFASASTSSGQSIHVFYGGKRSVIRCEAHHLPFTSSIQSTWR